MSHWVSARVFATQFEAELARARVESADIPATIRTSDGPGIFGPGFQGFVPGGVQLQVPDDRLAEVIALLDEDEE